MATAATEILFTDVPVLTHRPLIDEELWERVVNRMLSDYKHMKGMNRALAERCLNEALGYLQLCAIADKCYSPAPLVDLAWHTLIVYTYHYRELCTRIAGRFIDHEPFDVPDVDYGNLSAKPSEQVRKVVLPTPRQVRLSVTRGSPAPLRCGAGRAASTNKKDSLAGCLLFSQ